MANNYRLSDESIAGNIPALILAREGLPSDAPLVITLHGLGSHKERLLGGLYEFAQIGCRAVAVDLYLHGARPESEERDRRLQVDYFTTTAEIIEGTAQDVSRVIDHFGAEKVAIHGISLGGYITFAALLAEPRLKAASVALGSPDWVGPLRRFGLGPGHPAYDRAAALNPLDLLPSFLPTRPLLLLHGSQDEMVPPSGVIALEERLRPLYAEYSERLKLELFPELGHVYTDEMLSMTVAWFHKFLVDAH